MAIPLVPADCHGSSQQETVAIRRERGVLDAGLRALRDEHSLLAHGQG